MKRSEILWNEISHVVEVYSYIRYLHGDKLVIIHSLTAFTTWLPGMSCTKYDSRLLFFVN